MDQVVLDVLLPGRGVPWVRFEVDDVPAAQEGQQAGVTNERIYMDYVHWEDFAHSPERNWAAVERVGWVARKTALTKREGTKRFGEKFANVEMSMSSRSSESLDQRERSGDKAKYGEVWEIWDTVTKRRIFVAKGAGDILEERDDPYGLTNFFPCPRPAYSTVIQRRPVPNARLQAVHRPCGRTGRYQPENPQADAFIEASWRIRC